MAGVSPLAVEAAKKTISSGGNIVDAAVAASLVMAVTTPYFASLGGGGFALLHLKGQNFALDFRETAPQSTHPNYYSSKKPNSSTDGGTAVAVPGVVAGLWEMHKKFGSKKWSTLFTEALRWAENGFIVSGEWYRYTSAAQARLVVGADAFIKNKNVPEPSDRLIQKKLATALRLIQTLGPKGFYEGKVASDIVNSVKKSGGELSLQDLKNYSVLWREPTQINYLGHQVLLMPAPSSSAVVMSVALRLFELENLKALKPGSSQELHGIAESLKRAFRGRFLLGDPKFVKNPVTQLTSEEYIRQQFKSINMSKATEVSMADQKEFPESHETTHFSLMDSEGNAVAFTVTLNGSYGSGVVSEKYGIALNNEMDDFTARLGEPNQFGLIQGRSNQVEAGKRPISSMSPTLVLKDGQVVMSLGSQGGPRIISSVAQVLHRVIGQSMTMDEAIQFARVHHQVLPNKLYIDPLRSTADTEEKLKSMGHQIEESMVAKVYGVRKNSKGWFEAAFDSRGEGASGGL